MRNHSIPAIAVAVTLATTPAPAAVIVLGNYTGEDVTFILTEDGNKPRKLTLPAHHVAPFVVNGPASLTAPPDAAEPLRVDPYNAYVFLPDRVSRVRVEHLEMPGQMPERDLRAELNPRPREPVKVPVTLLVDDADPRTDRLWQAEVRKRFDAAAAILESQTGFRLEFAGFDTWNSDPQERHPEAQLAVFERAVQVKPGSLAVGFTSRKWDDGADAAFGACRGRSARHVLVREWKPKGEPERVEVLVRYLAIALGAVSSPDPGSALRHKLGDGRANDPHFVIRLDPLNALALNLWADLRRAGITSTEAIGQTERNRLVRVYGALLRAAPNDPLAGEYLADLERGQEVGRVAVPAAKPEIKPDFKPDTNKGPDVLQADRQRRVEAARRVVRAITDRARANVGTGALTGDALTAEYVRVAAETASSAEEHDRVPAFLLGLGVALDDRACLRENPLTSGGVKDIETFAERTERLKVLGNPTLGNRRDLCRRFFVGGASGELLTPRAAENSAVTGNLALLNRPAGFGFPSLAAEFAGIAFARAVQSEPKLLEQMKARFSAAEVLPELTGLRDGLSADKFEDDYGGLTDERFRGVVAEIRKRIKAVPLYRTDP
jgi:hypothetical protein